MVFSLLYYFEPFDVFKVHNAREIFRNSDSRELPNSPKHENIQHEDAPSQWLYRIDQRASAFRGYIDKKAALC
jgi:hypothetical protein